MSVPLPTNHRRGKQVPNSSHTGIAPVVVHRLKFYGDADRLRFAMEFQEKQRRLKVPKVDVYGLTVAAMCKKFGIAESTAHKDMGGLRAYRQAKFHAELPTIASRTYENLQRLSQKAEADKQYLAAISAEREIAKLTGIYAPIKLEVQHSVGESLQVQLAKMSEVLSKEQRAQLEGILATWEIAEREGRLQLASGDEDEPAPGEIGEDVEDGEVVSG